MSTTTPTVQVFPLSSVENHVELSTKVTADWCHDQNYIGRALKADLPKAGKTKSVEVQTGRGRSTVEVTRNADGAMFVPARA